MNVSDPNQIAGSSMNNMGEVVDKRLLRKRLEQYMSVGLADQIAEEVSDSLWFALEVRSACAEAWDEGAKAQADGYGMDVDVGPNPYRDGAA